MMYFDDVCERESRLLGVVANWRHARRRVAQVLLTLAVTGCAGLPGSGDLTKDSPASTKSEAVAQRAQARWQALIGSDLPAAYEYLSPGTRSTMTYEQYKSHHRVGLYRAAKIDSVTCEGEACTVKLTLTYDAKMLKGIVTPVTEKWVIEQGQAWIVELR